MNDTASSPTTQNLDRNLALELVRVTEAAALAASRLMGGGPAGGSYYIESLTTRLEEEAEALIRQVLDRGGMVHSIETASFSARSRIPLRPTSTRWKTSPSTSSA